MKTYKYLLLAIVPVIVGLHYVFQLYSKIEEKSIDLVIELKLTAIEQIANSIDTQFKLINSDITDLSSRSSVINLNEEGKKEIDAYYSAHSDFFVSVTRINKDGFITYSSPYKNVIGRFVGNQAHNKLSMETQKPVISDVFMAVQGFYAISYTMPVFKENKYDGAVAVLIPISKLGELLFHSSKLNGNSQAFFISESGVNLFSTFDKQHIGENFITKPSIDPALIRIYQNMLMKKSGTEIYSGYTSLIENEKAKKWITYKPINLENTFWSVGIVISENEILGKIRGLKSDTLIIILISLFSFALLIVLYIYSSKKAQKEIRKRDQKYTVVTEQTGQIVYEYDVESGEVNWSGAINEVTGFEETEFKKINVTALTKLIHPDDLEIYSDTFNSALPQNKKHTWEYRIKTKNGNYVFIEDNCLATVEEGTGRLKHFGTMKNITNRKRAEALLIQNKENLERLVIERTKKLEELNEQLQKEIQKLKETEEQLIIQKEKAEESDKLKTEFLAQVSHEIRTPLNNILSFASLIQSEAKGKIEDDLLEGFYVVNHAGARIIRTVDLILNMSELQTKSYKPIMTEIDLITDIIMPLLAESKLYAESKGLTLDLKVNDSAKEVLIVRDRYSVGQIFANLIDNAIKYTEKGGVTVEVSPYHSGSINVKVTDTGIGISKEYLSELFAPFSQEEQGYTRKYEGNGLGLALVKKYCEINNADIKVDSQKGKGSTFTVTFN
ncbi:MAG: PAS domain-containing protein [Melioribacteraceae bacterium]|nr:PAS domain-containing protein [Melioribacteraceae bacterium]